MDPGQSAGVGMGAKAGGSILSAIGALNEGTAGAAAYTYKAGMAQINKSLALGNADYARKVGEFQATESGLKSRFQQGKILSGQSASGFDVNAPGSSAESVRDSQQKIAQIDQGVIRANAARTAYGFDVEAAKDESESAMDLAAAKNVKSASYLTAATSILGGVSSVADKWSQASQYGLYGGGKSGGVVGPTDGDSYVKE